MNSRLEIVLGQGEDYERIIYVEKPRGRRSREMMPKVLKFMAQLKDMRAGDDLDAILQLVDALWSRNEFEDELVPYVLGMEDAEGRQYLNDNGNLMEIMEAFSSAANYLIEQSFGRKEVQDALGKSTEEALVEAPRKTKKAE